MSIETSIKPARRRARDSRMRSAAAARRRSRCDGAVGCASRIGTSKVARHEIAHQRPSQRRPRFNRHDVLQFAHSTLLTSGRGAADGRRRVHDVVDETTSCAAPARLRIGAGTQSADDRRAARCQRSICHRRTYQMRDALPTGASSGTMEGGRRRLSNAYAISSRQTNVSASGPSLRTWDSFFEPAPT